MLRIKMYPARNGDSFLIDAAGEFILIDAGFASTFQDFIKADLTAPTVKYDSMGAMQLESKQDMKRRGLSSPDAADALALTFSFPLGTRESRLHKSEKKSYYTNNTIYTSWLGA